MGQVTGLLGFTLFYFVLFLLGGIFYNIHREKSRAFLESRFPLVLKIPWDTVWKGTVAAGLMLMSRKLLYYLIVPWTIQTPFSIQWMDKRVVVAVFFIIVLYVSLVAFRGLFKGIIIADTTAVGMIILSVFVGFVFVAGYLKNFLDFEQITVLLASAPPLLVKMACGGQYLGIFTSLALGYFIIERYKKIKPVINKDNARYLKWPAAVFFLFWLFSMFYFPSGGEGDERFREQVKTAKYESRLWGLVSDARSLENEQNQYYACKDILPKLKGVDISTGKKIIEELHEIAGTMESTHYQSQLLKDLALTLTGTGDMGDMDGALRLSEEIKEGSTRLAAYLELIPKIAASGKIMRLEGVFPKAVTLAKAETNLPAKFEALRKLALAASGIGKKEWGLPALEQAEILTMGIKAFDARSKYLQKLALAAAVMGYRQHAVMIAQHIGDTDIFGKTLLQIDKITGHHE